jgi:TetR/AcrR family transcriptional repressor of nem operon
MEKRGAAIRARLVDAALDHVWDHGYGTSTIAAIAEHAGIPRGSVFYHFPTKDDIVVAAIEAYVAQAHQRRLEKLMSGDGGGQKALDRFRSYFRGRLEARRASSFRRGCLLGNLAGEIGGQDFPRIAQAVRRGLQVFEKDMLAFLEASSKRGQLAKGTNLKPLAATIVNGWEGALLQMKLQQSPAPLSNFIASFDGVFTDAR